MTFCKYHLFDIIDCLLFKQVIKMPTLSKLYMKGSVSELGMDFLDYNGVINHKLFNADYMC